MPAAARIYGLQPAISVLLHFLLDVVGCILLQWLQYPSLGAGQLAVVLDAIYSVVWESCENGPVM